MSKDARPLINVREIASSTAKLLAAILVFSNIPMYFWSRSQGIPYPFSALAVTLPIAALVALVGHRLAKPRAGGEEAATEENTYRYDQSVADSSQVDERPTSENGKVG